MDDIGPKPIEHVLTVGTSQQAWRSHRSSCQWWLFSNATINVNGSSFLLKGYIYIYICYYSTGTPFRANYTQSFLSCGKIFDLFSTIGRLAGFQLWLLYMISCLKFFFLSLSLSLACIYVHTLHVWYIYIYIHRHTSLYLSICMYVCNVMQCNSMQCNVM